ncbi:hypothetical protein OCU04_006238 [Sclerotinia nivalis]|uniref:Uncharacterized protein n=1 Tax=Sclerotinia nivalis TaxID=352851 RepID=A0A9X0ANH2_9HELO|nr:hypothetical protein OCU04_006238 [Sclerotinia nivalis]
MVNLSCRDQLPHFHELPFELPQVHTLDLYSVPESSISSHQELLGIYNIYSTTTTSEDEPYDSNFSSLQDHPIVSISQYSISLPNHQTITPNKPKTPKKTQHKPSPSKASRQAAHPSTAKNASVAADQNVKYLLGTEYVTFDKPSEKRYKKPPLPPKKDK